MLCEGRKSNKSWSFVHILTDENIFRMPTVSPKKAQNKLLTSPLK